MTDKQIIIDGVDVSECNFTLERDGKIKCECTHATGFGVVCDCESWKTCDYKNYKRKEQECEELKKYLHKNFEEKDKLHLIIDRLLEASGYDTNTASAEDFEDVYENMRYEKQQLDQLKAENDKMKKQVCGLRPELKYIIDKTCSKYNIEAKYYHEKIIEIINNLNKLSKILTEIKEIADKDFRHTAWEEYAKQLKQILQKISECEVQNAR